MKEVYEETISDFYRNKIKEEEIYVDYGPLKRAVRGNVGYNNTMMYGVNNDYAGDDLYSIDASNTILHKYEDRLDVISKLLYKLDENWIRNLSIFITDPLNCIEEYRVSIQRCQDIWKCIETEYP